MKIIEDFYFNETDNAYELRRKCQNGNDFCVQGKRYSKYDTISDTITNSHSGNVIEPLICASRGRNPENPSNRPTGADLEQRIEVNEGGTSNALTSVQKDNYLIEPNSHKYRIRKLTPKECIRLMNFDDSDYDKIKAIGMSDSQIYKQCGNSIIVACLEGIFRKMYIDTEVSNEQLSLF